jgi:FkbM family methyltransferase
MDRLLIKRLIKIEFFRSLAQRVAQNIYDRALNPPYSGRFNRLKRNILERLVNWVLRYGDPLVTCKIANTRLFIPFSHKLPHYLRYHPQYSANMGRVAALVQKKYPDLTFIDVGANIGDTVALLRKHADFSVLCIEGDAAFFPILEKNLAFFKNVDAVQTYLGDSAGHLNADVVTIGGTAHLKKSTNSNHTVSTVTLTDLLKNKSLFARSKMLKIDTDGFDGKILRGAVDYISQVKPVIFFEYDPDMLAREKDNGVALLNFLKELGYRGVLVYENVGDFMMSMSLESERLIEELDLYYTGRNSLRYLDLCLFSQEDNDLFESSRASEFKFFSLLKKRPC